MPRSRVLIAVASLNSGGGIETALLNFLRTVPRDGLEIDVCVFDTIRGDLVPVIRALGYKVWTCPMYRNPAKFVAQYEARLREHGPYDVVHDHAGDFAGPMVTAARRVGIPVRIAHYHNVSAGHRNDWKRRLYHAWVRRYVLRDATAIVGCSWAALRSWFPREWRSDSRMCVVRCGVDVRRFAAPLSRQSVRRELGIPAGAPVIGHVGRFVWQKNHAGLIAAAARVIAARPDARLLLVGGGPLQESIAAKAAAAGLADNVIFAGHQADVPRFLAAMDLFVLPSVAEGFGLAAVEAQAAGLPVATTRLDGPFEAVAPDFHAYAFEAADDAGMAEALLRLLQDVPQAGWFSQAAREHARRFALEDTTAQMLSVWGLEVAVAAETAAAAPAAARAAA